MNLSDGTSGPGRSSEQSPSKARLSGIFKEPPIVFVLLPVILVVTALVGFLPPDGIERAEWARFIGSFHPLTVHFPIALFLVVPILELVGRRARFSYLRLSVHFVLGLATLAAAFAAILGWILGRTGGYSGPLIVQHMWGGILFTAICWLCWMLRTTTPAPGKAYGVALVVGVGLVSWTGYRGGQLSLGANHLTEHMPATLRHVLGVENAAPVPMADPHTFYGARVQPILTARCVTCHSADKHKGDLRLDSYRSLMHGGKSGPVVLAGNMQGSDLLRRIKLPASHDDFMPKGKLPLSVDQVKVIELWIDAGASDTLAVDAIKNAPSNASGPAVAEVTFGEIDPTATAKLRVAIAPAVEELQKRFPNILDYESRGSGDLRLNASTLGSKFGDKDLEAFAPVAEHIILADLSRTSITDRSAVTIAKMKRIRVLRLANTGITDALVLQLETLDKLESLNVFGTAVTPAVFGPTAKLPKLAHLYAGQTAIPPGTSIPPSLAGKIVF